VEASGVEKFFGASGVERVLRDVGLVGPVIGRKDAAGNLRLAVQQISNQCSSIRGEGRGLSNFFASEERVLEIDAEVGEVRTGAPGERERWLLNQDRN